MTAKADAVVQLLRTTFEVGDRVVAVGDRGPAGTCGVVMDSDDVYLPTPWYLVRWGDAKYGVWMKPSEITLADDGGTP